MRGKLARDPLAPALLAAGGGEGLGDVVDLGCGRGPFAALLLASGRASKVLGLDRNARLLAQARRALAAYPFAAREADLATLAAVPACDTVLLLDVLYQLPAGAQLRLVTLAAAASRRRLLIRTPDPAPGWRARLTDTLERAARPFWPHSGGCVEPLPPGLFAERLARCGFEVETAPCWAGTPFANVLLTALAKGRRMDHAPEQGDARP